MLKITHVDKIEFIKYCYANSRPIDAAALLQYKPGELERPDELINPDGSFHLECVDGRAVNMICIKQGDEFYIFNSWQDHTLKQFDQLRKEFNI